MARKERIAVDVGASNAYADALDAGHKVDRRWQVLFIICVAIVVVYVFAALFPRSIVGQLLQISDSMPYTFSEFVMDFQQNLSNATALVTGDLENAGALPTTLATLVIVALTGAGMALSGCVYQGTFRNALVTPSTLGVMSGATLGMVVWVVLAVPDEGAQLTGFSSALVTAVQGSTPADAAEAAASTPLFEFFTSSACMALCSFVGCFLVVGLVLLAVHVANHGSARGIIMIVTGQVIAGVIGAITTTVRYYYATVAPDGGKTAVLTAIQIGSFYRAFTWVDVLAVGLPVLVVFVLIMRWRTRLQLLTFAEGEARSMGVETKRLRYAVIGLCTLLTAIIVSFCGHVGFVGFLVPHMARRLVGPDFKYLLPASLALGALFVLGAYALLQITLGGQFETMCGMYISIFGACVFLVTAVRGQGGVRGEFR